MRQLIRFSLAALTSLAVLPALADTLSYSFEGVFHGIGLSQHYSGSYTLVDPVLSPSLPPNLAGYTGNGISSQYYTGAGNLEIVFASGTRLSAPVLHTIVNRNSNSVLASGSPYPLGLSMQLYTGLGNVGDGVTITPPSQPVCATPTGVCGEDDDPLYEDGTQASILSIAGVYFAFYNAAIPAGPGPLPGVPGLPSVSEFGGLGMGVYTPGVVDNGTQLYNTTLTQLSGVSEQVILTNAAPVPEPSSLALAAFGAGLLLVRSRRTHRAHRAH